MWQIYKILLIILLPLAWGLGTDLVFAKLRDKRNRTIEGEKAEK